MPLVLLAQHFEHPFVFLQKLVLRRNDRPKAAHATPGSRITSGECGVLDQVRRDQCARPPKPCQTVDGDYSFGALDYLQDAQDKVEIGGSAVGELHVVEFKAATCEAGKSQVSGSGWETTKTLDSHIRIVTGLVQSDDGGHVTLLEVVHDLLVPPCGHIQLRIDI